MLNAHRGRELDTAGDGFFAVFDGPARAVPGTVLVTSTVKDLTAGAGIQLVDAGNHEFKGVPGNWQLFVATA